MNIDACGIVDIKYLKDPDVRRSQQNLEALEWSGPKGIGVAYHVAESDIWFIEPFIGETDDEYDVPLFVLDSAPEKLSLASWLKATSVGTMFIESPTLSVRIVGLDKGHREGVEWFGEHSPQTLGS